MTINNYNYKTYNSYSRYNNHPSGGYKSLPFFKQAEIIYDFTVEFCNRYIDNRSRTHNQMIQASPSGKQNIAEGYLQKNLESRIKLLGVSRASFEELLNDYQDFLRHKHLTLWDKNSPQALKIRQLGYNRYKNYNDYKPYLASPEVAANAIICLTNQTNRLLDQKLCWTEERFIQEGGFREHLLKKD